MDSILFPSFEEALKTTAEVNVPNAVGWALITLGLLASIEKGDYQRDNHLCQDADSKRPSMAHLAAYKSLALFIAAVGLDDVDVANQFLVRALTYGRTRPSPVMIALCLPISALIFARWGHLEWAAELLALAFTHPIRASTWMEKWPLLNLLCADLENDLGTAVYTAAWERGKSLVLEAVITDVLGKFQSAPDNLKQEAPSPLTSGLTRRELEVLRLVAAGQSNRAIADELVISAGTVKWYMSQIYHKLDVESRTQAVARGRTLRILL